MNELMYNASLTLRHGNKHYITLSLFVYNIKLRKCSLMFSCLLFINILNCIGDVIGYVIKLRCSLKLPLPSPSRMSSITKPHIDTVRQVNRQVDREVIGILVVGS